MKYLDTLLHLGCFSFEDAVCLTGNYATAASMLSYYTKHGFIAPIRKGLYTAINPISKDSVANKFAIGSKLTTTSYISHHSAFEYHGYANQVSYRVFVSSASKFNSFEFDGYYYTRLHSNINIGIINDSNGIKVTDIERTVLDSIDDFEKDMGFEELIQCISAIPTLSETKLIIYLNEYNKCFLWQKVGFIFDHFRDNFDFSDDFFNICKKKSGTSSRYLLNDSRKLAMDFSNKWHLTYPKNLWKNLFGGYVDDVI